MKYRGMKNWLKKSVAAYLATGFIAIVPSVGQAEPAATTLPTGLVAGGTVTQTTVDAVMTVNGSADNNVASWESFSIGKDATVNFQDGKNFLNLVNGSNMSEIYGKMNGSGNIYLINPNGILFGDSAQINVGSLHASTRPIDGSDWATYVGSDGNVIVNSTVGVKSDIVNLGKITANYIDVSGINVTFKNIDDDLVRKDGEGNFYGAESIKASGYVHLGKDKDKKFAGQGVWYSSTGLDGAGSAETGGTQEYYALIKKGSELKEITDDKLKENFMLNDNIALTDNWEGIGAEEAFTGKFDGLNYTVKGLAANGDENVGLFAVTKGATVENVKLENVSVTGNTNVGALIGLAKSDGTKGTTVNNIAVVSGTISSNYGGSENEKQGNNIGGVIGKIENGGSVSYISVAKDVAVNASKGDKDAYGSVNVGGIVGLADEGAGYAKDTKISYVSNEANVMGGSNVGGIAGTAKAVIEHAFNAGNVGGGNQYGGASEVGGIAGSGFGNISDAHNAGNLNGSRAGGVVGLGGYNTVSDSSNSGNIQGWDNSGGIYGKVDDGAAAENTKIENSYNYGKVDPEGWADGDTKGHIGGVVGGNSAKADTASATYVKGEGVNAGGADKWNTAGIAKSESELASSKEASQAAIDKITGSINAKLAFAAPGTEPGKDDPTPPPKPPTDPDADSSKPTLLPTGWESNNSVAVDNATANTLGITSSDANNVINWQTYSIGEGNKVAYDNKNYLNIVKGDLSTEIYGILTAEGNVYILNPNGVLVGDKAYINVGAIGVSARTGAADLDAFNNGGNPFGNAAAGATGNIVVLGTKKLNLNGEDAVLTLEGNNVTVKDAKGVKAAGKLIKAKGYVHIGNDADKTLTATALDGTTAKADSIGAKDALDGIAYYELIDASELDSKLYGSGNFMLKGDGAISGYGAWHGDADTYGVKDVKIDGLGYTVSGLDANNEGSGWCGTGLIRGGENIDIENVKFTDVNVHSGAGYTGALIGNAKNVVIRNVYVGGTITSDNLDRNTGVGGFIGNADGDIYIENSANEANIVGADGKGSGYGGLVGTLAGGTLTVKNAYNTGNITAESDIAGIVGSSAGTANISNVYTTFGEVANGSASLSNAYSLTGEAAHKIDSYAGFDISSKADSSKTWRIYDGVSAPMLVSLFKGNATTKTEGTQSIPLQYDGKGHNLKDVGVTVSYDRADAANYGGEVNHVNAGTYNGNNVSSSQLGYNIVDNTTMNISKKNISFGVVHKVSDHTNVVNAEDAAFDGVIDGDNVVLDVSKTTATISSTDINADANWNLLPGKTPHTVIYQNAALAGADAGNYELQTDGDVVVGLGLIREKDNPMEYLPAEEVSEAYNTIGTMQAETSNGEEPAVVVVTTSSVATVAGEPSAVSVENGETMKIDPKQSVHDNRNGEKNGKEKNSKKNK